MCKVSVVIPTYKRNDYLERAIQSVLAQTIDDYEIIIVDDNHDGTKYRIQNRKIEKKYRGTKVRFLYNEKNIGGAGARNNGIENAKGDYIAFLDDDDTFEMNKLERMLEEMDRNNAEMAYSYVKSDNGKKYQNYYFGNAMYELFRDGCLAATSQWVISKDALESVQGFDITPAKQDSILTFKLLSKGYEILCVPELLSIYYEHDEDRISNSGSTLIGETNLYEKYRSVQALFSKEQKREIEANFCFRMASYSLRQKRLYFLSEQLFKLIFLYPDFLMRFGYRKIKKKRGYR